MGAFILQSTGKIHIVASFLLRPCSFVMYCKGHGVMSHCFCFFSCYSNDGAMCAMKEVDVVSYDTKSAECIKQLEQVVH